MKFSFKITVRCKCCGQPVPAEKEHRNAGKVYCRRLCAEFDALKAIEKRAGDAFGFDVVV